MSSLLSDECVSIPDEIYGDVYQSFFNRATSGLEDASFFSTSIDLNDLNQGISAWNITPLEHTFSNDSPTLGFRNMPAAQNNKINNNLQYTQVEYNSSLYHPSYNIQNQLNSQAPVRRAGDTGLYTESAVYGYQGALPVQAPLEMPYLGTPNNYIMEVDSSMKNMNDPNYQVPLSGRENSRLRIKSELSPCAGTSNSANFPPNRSQNVNDSVGQMYSSYCSRCNDSPSQNVSYPDSNYVNYTPDNLQSNLNNLNFRNSGVAGHMSPNNIYPRDKPHLNINDNTPKSYIYSAQSYSHPNSPCCENSHSSTETSSTDSPSVSQSSVPTSHFSPPEKKRSRAESINTVDRERRIRPKVVAEKGALQCKGVNRKKSSRCRNAALMEYIGPRPLYCAEHIMLDSDSFYSKCASTYHKVVGDGKGCREVVLKEFEFCHKHYSQAIDAMFNGTQDGLNIAHSSYNRICFLLNQLENEAAAAKKSDPDLFQRKHKLIPKFMEMKKVLHRRLTQHDSTYGTDTLGNSQTTKTGANVQPSCNIKDVLMGVDFSLSDDYSIRNGNSISSEESTANFDDEVIDYSSNIAMESKIPVDFFYRGIPI